MNRRGHGRKIRGVLCLTVICGLLFTGCCGTGVEQNANNLSEDTRESSIGSGESAAGRENPGGSGESAAGGENPGGNKVSEAAGAAGGGNSVEDVESGEDHCTGEEILARLIEDEGFRERVCKAAGIEEEDTEEEIRQKLEQCESLVLRSKAVGSLADLRLLPNLRRLVIDYDTWEHAQIEDFTPIAGLCRLEKLYISYPAEDLELSFLAGMDTVTDLSLVNCDLKDSSFLGEMSQLECLSLYQTPVADLAVLENLTKLVELALCGNREAEHMETVGSLTKMRDLGLQDCGIEDIGFLSNLTELRSVNLNGNLVSDLRPLSGLTNLERLGLAENEVSDPGPIAGLENLFDLALDGNQISDISALESLSRLNQAGLSDNRIQDFSPLADKPELLYVSVLGNPCIDPRPLLRIPLLNFENGIVTEQQQKTVADWMQEQRPDVVEYECIDCVEADLDGDGLSDIAFVADGEFGDGDEIYSYDNLRRLFILLRQRDGSFTEVDSRAVHMSDPNSGGMRGDPYRGIWMGEGYVLVRQGWGSSTGSTETGVYRYRNGSLEEEWHISLDDCVWAAGYFVTEENVQAGTYVNYAIALDGYCLVRADLSTNACPGNDRFPMMDLYSVSYYAYPEKLPVRMSGVEALEYLRSMLEGEWEQEKLSYTSWQKESYELVKGVELPDYWYAVRETPVSGEEETDGFARELYYLDLEIQDRETETEGYYHVIRYVGEDGAWNYRIDDSTGEIEEVDIW